MPVIYQGGGSSGESVGIPELYTDPVSPVAQSAWILATQIAQQGSPIGLALALTYAMNMYTYQFSYRTIEGTTIRTPLT